MLRLPHATLALAIVRKDVVVNAPGQVRLAGVDQDQSGFQVEPRRLRNRKGGREHFLTHELQVVQASQCTGKGVLLPAPDVEIVTLYVRVLVRQVGGRAMPAGQCRINGVEMPPSCVQCLYRRNGALLRLAQAVP